MAAYGEVSMATVTGSSPGVGSSEAPLRGVLFGRVGGQWAGFRTDRGRPVMVTTVAARSMRQRRAASAGCGWGQSRQMRARDRRRSPHGGAASLRLEEGPPWTVAREQLAGIASPAQPVDADWPPRSAFLDVRRSPMRIRKFGSTTRLINDSDGSPEASPAGHRTRPRGVESCCQHRATHRR